jgi:hypothetical protein
MASKDLQGRIFITPEKSTGDSLALVMKLEPHSTAESVHEFLHELWIILKEIRSGELAELKADTRLHKYPDYLSFILAFSPGIFDFISLNRNQKTKRLSQKSNPSFHRESIFW